MIFIVHMKKKENLSIEKLGSLDGRSTVVISYVSFDPFLRKVDKGGERNQGGREGE